MFQYIVMGLLLIVIFLLAAILIALRNLDTWQDIHASNAHKYGQTILGRLDKI